MGFECHAGPFLREPRAPFGPFLRDGDEFFLVLDWRAGRASEGRVLRVRRLAKGERRAVRASLDEAAEEAFYRLVQSSPTQGAATPRRRRRR